MPIPSTISPTDPGRIRQAIADAARRTGVDFDYLYKQARVESGLDPAAKARTSSASGLFQFTRQTWLHMVKTHGAENGLQWAADAIGRSGGRYVLTDPIARAAVDNLRFDPDISAHMAGEYAAENGLALEQALDRAPEPVDLYLAHFLGAAGATRFLRAHDADPATAAAGLLPDAAAANRTIFFTPDGRSRSVGEIRASFAAKLDGAGPASAAPAASGYAPQLRWTASRRDTNDATSQAPLELASIDPMPPSLSLDFAARAYRRLAGLGA